MKRKAILLIMLWLFVATLSFAQGVRLIKGNVTDGKEPVIGASVSTKCSNKKSVTGVVTDADGNFAITVSDAECTALVITYLGMKTKEITLDPKTDNYSVQLEKDPLMLNEVRITAIGDKRSNRKIGYSASQVQGDKVAQSGEGGVIQGLSGKASNVQITRNTGDPGAGAYIQIRGQSTITSNLQPLVVVDGVPVSNSSFGGGTGSDPTAAVVQQSRLNDLNPEDIASVEILKGAAAAAVWGTRAANGVILVTTKKGRPGKKGNINVEVSSSVALDYVNREFDKQSIYGQGSAGNYVANNALSWGDKISSRAGGEDAVNTTGAKFVAADGTIYYPLVKKNSTNVYNDANRDQVFRTGKTFINNVTISSANEKNSVYFNIADWNQEGVLNGLSDYRRTSGRLNYSQRINNKVNISMNSFLSKIFSNRIQQGSNLDGLYLGYLRTPADFDNTDYIGTYFNAAGEATFNAHRGYRRYLGNAAPTYNNPGWTLNKQTNTSDVIRFIATPEIKWEWMPESELTVRAGYDVSNDRRITYFPYNSAATAATGYFADEFIKQSELSLHAYNKNAFEVNQNIQIHTTIGYLYTNRSLYSIGGIANQFNLKNQDKFAFINSTSANQNPFNSISNILNNRAYAILDLDLYDKFFIQLTGASEAASTFQNRFFYPSATIAYEFTKDVLRDNRILSYGKLRGSWGMVGVEPPPYIWNTNYVNAIAASSWGETLEGSQFGGSVVRSSTQGNPDIKPEQKSEIEFGADLKFFQNVISLSATYYQNKTTDAIFQVDVPPSTGYTSKWANAATISNKGYEAELNVKVFDKKDLLINVYGNIGSNQNMVDDLSGAQSIFLDGFTGTSSRAVQGHALGSFWGVAWQRNDNGTLALDANGFPVAATSESVIGDPNANYRAGFGTNASWKGLSLNVLFETSQGNQMWAGTYGVLNYFGINPETANEVTVTAAEAASIKNYNGETIDQLATANADGSYTLRGNLKDFGAGKVLLDQSWYTGLGGGFGPVAEDFIVDASWFRLREVSLSYALPSSITKKLGLGGISLGFTGRNLLLWTDVKGIDPELNLTGTSNGRGLDYFTNPGTRSYIFNLRITL